MPDPDFEIRGEVGGGEASRPLDKGEAVSKKLFSALRASVWSDNKGGGGGPGDPLDPSLSLTEKRLERFSYDLEMKAREQNRNDKRREIERFDWFIERTDKRA